MQADDGHPPTADATRAFYDRLSRAYDLIADRSERRARKVGLRLLAPGRSERILEIGCGTGSGLVQLTAAVGGDGAAVGLDLSSGMLAVARRRFARKELDPPRLVHADARRLPLADGIVDGVFLSFTLELFEEPQRRAVLAEIQRVLRPAGRIAVVALNLGQHPGVVTELYRWLHRHFPHIVDCQPIDVAATLAAARFEVLDAERLTISGLEVLAARAERSPP